MTSEETLKREYKQFIPIENLVAAQINRIAEYRSKMLWEHYIYSVEMLVDLLPPDVEETVLEYKKEHNIVFNLSEKGKQSYVALFRFIKKQLTDQNIVWKRSRGYDVGHD